MLSNRAIAAICAAAALSLALASRTIPPLLARVTLELALVAALGAVFVLIGLIDPQRGAKMREEEKRRPLSDYPVPPESERPTPSGRRRLRIDGFRDQFVFELVYGGMVLVGMAAWCGTFLLVKPYLPDLANSGLNGLLVVLFLTLPSSTSYARTSGRARGIAFSILAVLGGPLLFAAYAGQNFQPLANELSPSDWLVLILTFPVGWCWGEISGLAALGFIESRRTKTSSEAP